MRMTLTILVLAGLAVPAVAEMRPTVHAGLPGDRATDVRVNRGPEVQPEPSLVRPPVETVTRSGPRVSANCPTLGSGLTVYIPPARPRPKAVVDLRLEDGDLSGRVIIGDLYHPRHPVVLPSAPPPIQPLPFRGLRESPFGP